MIKKLVVVSSVLSISLLSGCASVPDVNAPHSFWKNKSQTVAIAKTPAANGKAGFYPEGAQGILDIAINEGMNQTVKKELAQFNGQKILITAQQQFLTALRQYHINAKVVDTLDTTHLKASKLPPAKFSTKDYRQLSIKYGNDKLLTLTVDQLGEVREYYSFIPLGAPQAVSAMTGRLVDLKNNRIIWRHHAKTITSIEKPVKDPRNLYAAIDRASQDTIKELVQNFVINAKGD